MVTKVLELSSKSENGLTKGFLKSKKRKTSDTHGRKFCVNIGRGK